MSLVHKIGLVLAAYFLYTVYYLQSPLKDTHVYNTAISCSYVKNCNVGYQFVRSSMHTLYVIAQNAQVLLVEFLQELAELVQAPRE